MHVFVLNRLWVRALMLPLAFLLAMALPAQAQKDDYAEWLREQQRDYADFRNAQDAAFARFLASSWQDVDVRAPSLSPLKDKPVSVPSASGTENTPDSPTPPVPDGASPAPEPTAPAPDPVVPPEAEPTAPESAPAKAPAAPEALPQRSTASFFGTPVSVAYAAALAPTVDGAPRPEMVQRYWTAIARGPVAPFIERIAADRDRLALDDWGYYRYLTTLSETLYPGGTATQQNAATLWVWAMLVKSGYGARVGYNDREVFLMVPSDDRLYDVPQLRIDGQRYYLLNARDRERLGSLRTYDGQHPDASGTMRFDLSHMPVLTARPETRTVSFFYDGTTHSVSLTYNPAVLRYLDDYPNAELRILFQAGMSPEAHQALLGELRPLVEGRDEVDAINLLLRFVQKAFDYKVDEESFGEERFLFPEETLQMPASDCEDRAVLFAYLVRHLLDRQTVALRYPRHVATGVRLESTPPGDVPGTHVEVEGDTYVMADPTYMDATLGMAMPFVVGETPEIISIQ